MFSVRSSSLRCFRRWNFVPHRCLSSSNELSSILHEQSIGFQSKPTSTIAFETFLQAPAEFLGNSLIFVHDTVGLPWWATIGLTGCLFRVCLGGSVFIFQQRIVDRLQRVRDSVAQQIEPEVKYLNLQAMQGKTASVVEQRKILKRQVNRFVERKNEMFKGDFL